MKLTDIVNQIARVLPLYTPHFSDVLKFKTLSAVNGVVTVTLDKTTKLRNGQYITISGMQVEHKVVSLETESSTGLATVVLDSDHDLTDHWPANDMVTFGGCSVAEFNGTFEFVHQPNRRTIEFRTPSYYPPQDLIGYKFYEILAVGFNGAYPITVTSDTSFTFILPDTTFNAQGFNGRISLGQRVMGAISFARFLECWQADDKNVPWVVVCMEPASASKSRSVASDAIGFGGKGDFRQTLLEPFSVYAVIPTKNEIASVRAIDLCYSEIRNAIFHSTLGKAFPSDLDSDSDSGSVLVVHGANLELSSREFYVHQYSFETMKQITNEDTVINDQFSDLTHAFRDLVIRTNIKDIGNLPVQDINLDDEPFK